MSHCPKCNRRYDDESLRFCLDDGAPLLSSRPDSEATHIISPQQVFNLPATQVWQRPLQSSANPPRSNKTAYALVALIALIAGGALVWLLTNQAAKPSTDRQSATDNSSQREPKGSSLSSEPAQAANILNETTVRDLVSRWVRAQNDKDLRAYESCYAATFEGIKRTKTGRSYSYDFNGWMKDRWNMISVASGLNIEARNLRITIDHDSALVEFDQYYHSLKYSDWSPKVMKVRLAPTGEPKIVYEELRASYQL